ncbi:MAG: phosphoribosylformylglycinamidine synthase subunit PurL, partial [Spirochaetia bacterium]|nr:phosphoribosylformylglycinamidine synthase subunit PurL [Spirochaetia bacterium]
MASNELYSEKTVNVEDAKEHGLTEEEFEKIQESLGGRLPTVTELGVYSGLWSEHASYKNSILHLKTFPSESPRSLTKAGEENAGALDLGDGLAVVFKIESHNHPTAVEPYQGAATGVGGIMRDIFTMGARPICSLNSLRFGPPDNPRNRYLLKRAVKGIGDYGNCLGVAVSGGELFFDHSFSRNCLVNAMTVGIVEHGKMASAEASGKGNPVIYVGSTTGRDGIHGASFASMDLTEETESKRSAVQVGDPFMEKLLLEATLELIASDALVGIQDMGAAGLACATSEMSAKGNVGMDVNLDLIPFREEGMSAYEIMLSESQERMLVVGKKGQEEEIYSIFNKWGLHAVKIGTVTDDGILRLRRHGQLCAEIPAHSLVLGGGAPRYKRESSRPDYLDKIKQLDFTSIADSENLSEDLMEFVSSTNICSRRPLFDQYDTEVGLVKMIGPGADGGLARIPGTDKGIAVSTDCNSRYVYAEPRRGAAHAVVESARNVAVTGARPIGITNNLNFANPYVPENYYMFTESVAGIREACEVFDIPVTGGNVSFYNESDDGPIFPTPTIGMVGYIEDVKTSILPGFKSPGDVIFLLGKFSPCLGMSEYL